MTSTDKSLAHDTATSENWSRSSITERKCSGRSLLKEKNCLRVFNSISNYLLTLIQCSKTQIHNNNNKQQIMVRNWATEAIKNQYMALSIIVAELIMNRIKEVFQHQTKVKVLGLYNLIRIRGLKLTEDNNNSNKKKPINKWSLKRQSTQHV